MEYQIKKILSFILFTAIAVVFFVYNAGVDFQGILDGRKEKVAEIGHLGPSKKLFGMQIEDVSYSSDKISVTTTGAEFNISKNGIIDCRQRIPVSRSVAKIKIDSFVWPFQVSDRNEYNKLLAGNGIEFEFSGDSLLVIRVKNGGRLEFTGEFEPKYQASKNGKRIFIDKEGGFGIYPVQDREGRLMGSGFGKGKVVYDFQPGDEIWFSVFPPRPYDWQKVGQPLAHTGKEEEPYSSEPLIREAAKYAKVFTLHSFFMPGGDKEPWLIPAFDPSDMAEFTRVRDQVKENGMKFVVYASPYYSTAPDFFAELDKLTNKYKVDGVYFDGISFDFRRSYEIVRKSRQMLGDDKIIYIHSSVDPFNSTQLYAPFIDTYADYILRGEAGRPANVSLEDFLRYTVSGYNISSANGYWLHYGSAEVGQPEYDFNLPDSQDIRTALANHVYFPWSDTMYHSAAEEDWRKFTDEYFNSLKEYQKDNLPAQNAKR